MSSFEYLPDEILLEICRYLHCSHILYSFYNLNFRLNQTITSYTQHVWFRRASYRQLLHIYEYILPQIGSNIISLTIHPLHQSSFPISFKYNLSNICPYLKILTLTSWKSDYLIECMFNSLINMRYLEKLILQELSCSSMVNDQEFLERIFQIQNNYLTKIIFDYDCDSFNLQNSTLIQQIHIDHIHSLTIQLEKLIDFLILISYIPNIQQLDITIKDSSLEPVSYSTKKLLHLKEFSLWCVHWHSHLTDLPSLIYLLPSIQIFSLTLSTRDSDLINGEKLLSILPLQLKQFHYSVCYYGYEYNEQIDLNQMKLSWQTIPIIYSINQDDNRIFLHTLPYSSSRLIIRSSLAKNISSKTFFQIYFNINQIQVYTMKYISDIFPLLAQCRRVRELTLLISHDFNNQINKENNEKLSIQLPYLTHLDILTIEGIPLDLHHLKELFIAAINLTVLVIDLDCLLTILENDDQTLVLYFLLHQRILDLCIRIEGNTNNNEQIKYSTITIEQIHLIARVFTKVRNLTIDYETSKEFIQTDIIRTVINEFHNLVIFHIHGLIPDNIKENQIRNWILTQNLSRIKSNDIFHVECSNKGFKLWL